MILMCMTGGDERWWQQKTPGMTKRPYEARGVVEERVSKSTEFKNLVAVVDVMADIHMFSVDLRISTEEGFGLRDVLIKKVTKEMMEESDGYMERNPCLNELDFFLAVDATIAIISNAETNEMEEMSGRKDFMRRMLEGGYGSKIANTERNRHFGNKKKKPVTENDIILFKFIAGWGRKSMPSFVDIFSCPRVALLVYDLQPDMRQLKWVVETSNLLCIESTIDYGGIEEIFALRHCLNAYFAWINILNLGVEDAVLGIDLQKTIGIYDWLRVDENQVVALNMYEHWNDVHYRRP
jgi:hypothetical protein